VVALRRGGRVHLHRERAGHAPDRTHKAVGLQRPASRPVGLEYFQAGIQAGKNADLRPVQLRLRGVRRARLPGPRARLQTVTLPLRRGDAGLPLGRARTLRAARWRFIINFVDAHQIVIGGQIPNTGRGRRGPSRGYGFSIVLVQAGHRVGRIRATGRCGYLGCRGTALP
jgi:hypothetical protein